VKAKSIQSRATSSSHAINSNQIHSKCQARFWLEVQAPMSHLLVFGAEDGNECCHGSIRCPPRCADACQKSRFRLSKFQGQRILKSLSCRFIRPDSVYEVAVRLIKCCFIRRPRVGFRVKGLGFRVYEATVRLIKCCFIRRPRVCVVCCMSI
jgi:hypothetical protein